MPALLLHLTLPPAALFISTAPYLLNFVKLPHLFRRSAVHASYVCFSPFFFPLHLFSPNKLFFSCSLLPSGSMKVSLKGTLKTVVFICVFGVLKLPTSRPVMSVFMMSLPMEFTPHTEFITIDQWRKKKRKGWPKEEKNTHTCIHTHTDMFNGSSFYDEQR